MKLSRVSVVVVVAVCLLALSACSAGNPGPRGSTGSRGPTGKAGETGSQGPAGAVGATGATGASGARGATGAAGSTGATGLTGAAGATGATGAAGSTGAAGAAGATGAAGPAGPAAVSQYAYIYNLLGETIPAHADVVFSNNGDVTTGFAHVPNSAGIVVNASGEYVVSFSLTAVEPSQFGLTRNGQLVPGTIFGSASGDQQNTGTAILSAAAGDVLTLRSFEGATTVNLAPFAGGSLENSDAAFTIQKIG